MPPEESPIKIPADQRMYLELELKSKPKWKCCITITRKALEILEKAKASRIISCPVNEVEKFEDYHIRILMQKYILIRERGAKNYFYSLTPFGKKLID